MISSLKTGDIVLFSGRCKVARTIQVLTWCKWSHIGMIIKDEEHNVPYVYESTHDIELPCSELGRSNMGVQLVPFTDRVQQYKGNMAVRRLHGVSLSTADLNRLLMFRKEMLGRSFETSTYEFIAANYRLPFLRSQKDLESVFCMELIAQSYMEMGLLSTKFPSNKYVPAHFSSRCHTELLRGYLGKEFLIKKFKRT